MKHPKPLTVRQIEAAALVASGESFEAIVARVGISARTLSAWKLQPLFQDRVEALRARFAARVQDVAGMDAEVRLRQQADRWNDFVRTREKRRQIAIASGDAEKFPGADTGFFSAKQRINERNEVVERTWVYDRFFVDGMLKNESALSEGLGQKPPQQVEHSGPGGGPIQFYATVEEVGYPLGVVADTWRLVAEIVEAGRWPTTEEEADLVFQEIASRREAGLMGLRVPEWSVVFDFEAAKRDAEEAERAALAGENLR